MNAVVLLFCAWLTHSSGAVPDAPPQNTQRGVLDVVVFYADAPRDLDRYPVPLRRELQRFLQRSRAYRPRPRPLGIGSEMRMVYAAREGYEAKLVAAASAAGAPRLAQQYVDALRPCYEWEGFHDCPEREALFAEQHLRDHPDTPFRDLLRVLAAHRWLCAAEGYEYEQKPGEALRARRNYDEAVTSATVDLRSVLLTTAASELQASGRCHASDPFRKREPGATAGAPRLNAR